MCEVTVVIPNYNGEQYLANCLKALYERTNAEIKVIVVDNGSTDQSISLAKACYSEVEYMMLDKNYGFCEAVNQGILASNTPYVILLNNDTEIKEGFVEYLLKRIKQSETIFSVEAKMIQFHNQTLVDSAGTFYNALGWAFARGKDKKIVKFNQCTKCFAACAGAAIYRKAIFEEIGLFDVEHFAYLEDVDIGYRARINGYINCFEPKAEVLHVGSAASGSRYNEFKVYYSARNNIYMISKNMPGIQVVLNLPLLMIGFGVKTLFFLKKGLGKQYLMGIKDGMGMAKSNSYKVSFYKKNIIHYVRIQMELWYNIIRKFE